MPIINEKFQIHTKGFNDIIDITNYEILLDNQCYYSKNL